MQHRASLRSLAVLAGVALAALPAGRVLAQTLSFNIDAPVQNGVPNQTLVFSGTLTNTSAANLYINSIAFTPDSSASNDFLMVTLDGALGPDTVIAPGATNTFAANVFDVTVDPSANVFPLGGSVAILGGFTPGSAGDLGLAATKTFTINNPSAVVPESGTLPLAATGALFAVGIVAKRRKR